MGVDVLSVSLLVLIVGVVFVAAAVGIWFSIGGSGKDE